MAQPMPGATGSDPTFARRLMEDFRKGVSLVENCLTNVEDAWNSMLAAITDFLDRVRRSLEEEHWWAKAIEWITDDIADAVKKIQNAIAAAQDKIDSILDTMRKSLNGSVPVFSLFEVGLDWAIKVNTPLSDIAPDLSPSGAIDNWRGPAHETFKTRVADQADAIDAVVGKVSATSTWLAAAAQANVEFLADLASQMGRLVNVLTSVGTDTAEAAVADVAGVVQASNHMSEFIGALAESVVDYLAGLARRLADVQARINELANQYGDHTGLPGGTWPQAVNA